MKTRRQRCKIVFVPVTITKSRRNFIKVKRSTKTGGKAIESDESSWYLPWGYIVDDKNWQILDIVSGDRLILDSHKLTDIDNTRDEILAGGEKEMEIVYGKGHGTITQDYLKNLIGYSAEFNSVSKQYGLY